MSAVPSSLQREVIATLLLFLVERPCRMTAPELETTSPSSVKATVRGGVSCFGSNSLVVGMASAMLVDATLVKDFWRGKKVLSRVFLHED
jgi:hypothetical protein